MRRGTVSESAVWSRVGEIPAPGAHGDDRVAVAEALGIDPTEVLDLAATMNPLAPDPARVVAAHAGAARHYPDERRAREALADVMGLERERLVLTNGGAEAIALVAAEHPRGRVDEPEFGLFRRHLSVVDSSGPRWASNPNNPTGRLAASAEEAFVWDEAFYPLATGTWTRSDDATWVVGSLTKLLACPGLRIGYVLAPDAHSAWRLEERRPLWSLNSIAAAALPDLLGTVDLSSWSQGLAVLRGDLVSLLRSHGFAPLPSDAPWVLVPNAGGLRSRLVRHGILVRDCGSFGLASHARIAVPDAAGLKRLGAALASVGG